MFLSNLESIGEVVLVVVLVQFCKVNEVGSVMMDEGIEAQSTLPRLRKVFDVHILITFCYALSWGASEKGACCC